MVYKRIRKALRKRYVRKGKLNLKRVVKDVAMIKRLVNVEKKFLDNKLAFTLAVAGSCSVLQFLGPAQGTTASQRTGNSIKLLSWQCRLKCITQATTGTSVPYRIIVFIDKESNSTLNTITNIQSQLLNTDSNAGAGTNIGTTSLYNHDNRHRFTILVDKKYVLAPYGQTGCVQYHEFGGPLTCHQMYKGPNASDYDENQLYAIVVFDSDPIAPAAMPQFSWISRLTYTDN